MFIETLEEMLSKQDPLESSFAITRYMKANLQLTRSQFKPLKMTQLKKKVISDMSPQCNNLMVCTTNSIPTSDSIKVTKMKTLQQNEQQLPQANVKSKKNIKQDNSSLLRQTFGNFKIFKSYANTVKSTFQLSNNQKIDVESPIVANVCYQAPMVLGRSQKPQKRLCAQSQSERPIKLFLPPREQKLPKMKKHLLAAPSSSEQTRLPTLQSKPSICSTQTQQKSSLTSISAIKIFPEKPLSKSYLELDTQCISLLRNNNPLFKGDRFTKCRKISILSLTAERVCVVDSDNLELIYSDSHKDQQPIEIASLTKVVTALLSILICQRYGLDYKTYRCRISEEAAFMVGTSAQLQVGDTLTVENLLYALMLPSGNDASVTLAQNLGRVIIKHKKKPCKISPIKVFVMHMNNLYKQVIGDDANVLSSDSESQIVHLFQNPSGLSLNPNTTKPQQITLFATIAYRNEIFRTVVNQKEYQMTIRNDRYGLERKIQWKNTNKLLWKGWEGIKTGTTQNAGPCYLGKVDNYIVGVFNCASQGKRFTEAVALIDMIRRALA